MLAHIVGSKRAEAWRWWESRRLRYNIGLAMAGWIACGAFWAILFAYSGDSAAYDIALVAKVTLAMGVGFLVIMVGANVCYLLGVAAELVFKPTDLETFRGRAWDVGYWGSLALPFLLPLGALALNMLYGPSRY